MAEVLYCAVCGEEADEKTSSVCNSCNQRFHLSQRQDLPGKDCGTVWVDDYSMSLVFACQSCLDARSPEPPAPPKPRVIRPQVRRRRYRKRT